MDVQPLSLKLTSRPDRGVPGKVSPIRHTAEHRETPDTRREREFRCCENRPGHIVPPDIDIGTVAGVIREIELVGSKLPDIAC